MFINFCYESVGRVFIKTPTSDLMDHWATKNCSECYNRGIHLILL